jgi:uncharacterized alpha-E superfamily protein
MISRIAEHCFWFGRYIERAESTARVLRVTATLAPDAELTPEACWKPVLMVSGESLHFNALLGEKASKSGEQVQQYMSFSGQNQDRSIPTYFTHQLYNFHSMLLSVGLG